MKKVVNVAELAVQAHVDNNKIVKLINLKSWIERMYYFNEEWNEPITKKGLIKRGSCCSLGCKNCPYTKPRIKGNRELE